MFRLPRWLSFLVLGAMLAFAVVASTYAIRWRSESQSRSPAEAPAAFQGRDQTELLRQFEAEPGNFMVMEKLATIGAPAVPGVTRMLEHPNPGVRAKAVGLLHRIALRNVSIAPAVPALKGLAADPDPDVRVATLSALNTAEPDAFVANVSRALEDPHAKVRDEALLMVDGVQLDEPERLALVPRVVALLEDKDAEVRFTAAMVLVTFAPEEAARGERILEDAVRNHPQPRRRDAAARFLLRIKDLEKR